MNVGKKNNTPVLQDWVIELSWKEQTGLISAVRGLGLSEDSDYYKESKTITKMLRYLILNNADSKTSFMELDVVYLETDVSDVLYTISNLGNMYKHWYDHIMMAINIIYKKHNNPYVRHYYKGVKDCLDFLMLNKDDNIDSDIIEAEDIITSDDLKTLELEDNEDITPEVALVKEDIKRINFISIPEVIIPINEEPLTPEESISMDYYLPITRVTTDSDNTPVDGGTGVSYIVNDDDINTLYTLGLERNFMSILAEFDDILDKTVNINNLEELMSDSRVVKYNTYGDLPISKRNDIYFYISKLSPYVIWFVRRDGSEIILYSFTLHTYDSGYNKLEININHMNDVKSSIFDGVGITADMFKLLKKV